MNGSFGSAPGPAGSASLLPSHSNNSVAIVPANQTGMPNASASRASKMYRPQAYVHLEFGLSWSQGHLPNSHAVTYQSRALREQLSNTGHQLPPPQASQTQIVAPAITTSTPAPAPQITLFWDTTNNVYLRKTSRTQQRQVTHRHSSVDLAHRPRPPQPTHRHSTIEPRTAFPAQSLQTSVPSLWERHTARDLQEQQQQQRQQPPRTLTPVYEYESSISTRQAAQDLRGRGHSEPPSANPNHWAFVPFQSAAHPTGLGSAQQYAMHNTRSLAGPSAWKPLPDIPSRSRLGEDIIPWSESQEEPGADLDDERIRQSLATASTPAIVLHIPETTPIVVPIQSPHPDAPRYREIDPKRRNDMQVLSEAMMWGPEESPSSPSSAMSAHAVPVSRTSLHAHSAHRSNSVHHSISTTESNYDGYEEEALREPGNLVATAWPRRSSAPSMGLPPLKTSATMPSAPKAPLPPLSSATGTATAKKTTNPVRSTSVVSTVSAVSAVSAMTVSAVSEMSRTGSPAHDDPTGPANKQYVVSPLSTTAAAVSPLADTPALPTRPRRSTSEGSIMPWSPPGPVHSGAGWGSSVQQPHPLVRAEELFFDR